MPAEKRRQLLQNILEKDNWIIEGVYYKWVKQSIDDADVIYVLDMPRYLYRFRIIKRFIWRKLGLAQGKKETLKSLCDLLKWTDEFQNKNMKEVKDILLKYNGKVVYLKSSKEVRRLIYDRL